MHLGIMRKTRKTHRGLSLMHLGIMRKTRKTLIEGLVIAFKSTTLAMLLPQRPPPLPPPAARAQSSDA